jgi:hypothetical protein
MTTLDAYLSPGGMIGFTGQIGSSRWPLVKNRPVRNYSFEHHPLDAEFSLIVGYEYRSIRHIPAKGAAKEMKRSGARVSGSMSGLSTSMAAIDILLFSFWHRQFLVFPKVEDRIVFPPVVQRHANEKIAHLSDQPSTQ